MKNLDARILAAKKQPEKESDKFGEMAQKIFDIQDTEGFWPAVNRVFNDFGFQSIKSSAEKEKTRKLWLNKVVPLIKKLEHQQKTEMIKGSIAWQRREESRAGQEYEGSDLN
jgi:hypothetical protein